MLDTVITHVLDVLVADPRLIRGGPTWPLGFNGVTRIANGDEAQQDCVNIFDVPFLQDSDDARPGVYAGYTNEEATDELDFPSVTNNRIEYRTITLPLVVVARGATRLEASKKRKQLRANILYILLDHPIESGYWYFQNVPGSGGTKQRNWTYATGGGVTGLVESGCVIPVVLRYSFSQGQEES